MAIPTVIGRCPVCGDELTVTRLHCQACDTGIDGRFRLGRFGRLTPEQLDFVEVFLKNRGIIKDVEGELGISYPTVRARLDDALRAMGFTAADDGTAAKPASTPAREDRRQILEDLRARTITADEAAKRLAALSDRG